MVSCSLIGCAITISQSYMKWDNNPVIVTFSEKMTHLKHLPFPAVTICPETKSQKSIFDYRDTLRKISFEAGPPLYNLSERELKYASAQFQICDPLILSNDNNIGDNFTTDIIFDLIKEVAPSMQRSLMTCSFRTLSGICDNIFEEIITADGLCFTFNSLYPKEMFMEGVSDKFMSTYNYNMSDHMHWTLEDGYANGFEDDRAAGIYLYPYRVINAGSKAGLDIVMAMKMQDLDYSCRGPVQGFKVVLHPSDELPQVDGQFFRIPVGQAVRVSIKPNVLRTTKSLTGLHPKRRQCFFNFERRLRYMRTYSKRNCEMECLANYTLGFCGCVKFSMPHDRTTPICGIAKVNCYIEAEMDLLEDSDTVETSKKINSCNCLPACTSISYDTEISQSSYEWKNFYKALNHTGAVVEGYQFASFSIFFKENQFITSKRSELVGLTDFVSSCGGLLGLFMGVSILSIVELFYYVSLRLFCFMRSRKIEEERQMLPKLKLRGESQRRPWYIERI
ncbi:pickpocket protein 28-like [Bradysia coprophila]|nr:pickpocket protein 28-like [Bradysia coprophila]